VRHAVSRAENRHLILHSEDHLPPGWKQRYGAWIDWTWAFVLDDLGDDKTRFIVRSRLRAGPWWVAAAYLLAIIPADFVMSRQMLRGVKTRVERGGRANPGQDGRMRRREVGHGVIDVLSGVPLFLTSPKSTERHQSTCRANAGRGPGKDNVTVSLLLKEILGRGHQPGSAVACGR